MKVFAYLLSTAALAAIAIQFAGCTCTMVGCENGASTTLEIERELSTLDSAPVRICRNDECFDGQLVVQSDGERLQGFCEIDGAFCTVNPLGPDEVTVEFDIFADETDPEDGDVFRVVIMDPQDPDAVLAVREGEVDYVESEPNGEWCGDTCYNASF